MAMTAVQGRVESKRHSRGLRLLLAAVLVGLWLAWVVPIWLSALHPVRGHEFLDDLAQGRVVAFTPADNVQQAHELSGVVTDPTYDIPSRDSEGRPELGAGHSLIYTVDGGLRPRWVDPVPLTTVSGTDVFRALGDEGARPFDGETTPPSRDWAIYPAAAFYLTFVLALLTLPPRRATRPFWVFVSFAFMGIGVIGYAVAELLVPGRVRSDSPPLRWMHGIGILLIAVFVGPMLWSAIL